MAIPRVIPVLLLSGESVVKTKQFKHPNYIGDPLNTVKLFNELEVDEIILVDINASKSKTPIQFDLLKTLTEECFMPLTYGGGISNLDHIRQLLKMGIEKVILNTQLQNSTFLENAIKTFGSSTIVASIDVKKNIWGKYQVFTKSGSVNTKLNPIHFAQQLNKIGVGEIMVNSIDNDGMQSGYDLKLIQAITDLCDVPVVACGGAQNINDLKHAIHQAGASAVAAGSMFVYQGKHNGVLITYPKQHELRELIQQKKP